MSSKLSMDKLSIGCVALPGGSLVYKTGAWRTNRPVFKHAACNGCRACEMVCPEGCVFENPAEKHTIEQAGKKRESTTATSTRTTARVAACAPTSVP